MQLPTAEDTTPTPRSELDKVTPTPAASETQLYSPWPLVVLAALIAAALIGSVALVRTQRTGHNGEKT